MKLKSDPKQSKDHPTRVRLVETTVRLMDRYHPDEIKVSMILRESLVSKGSLYYHFTDAQELFEVAEVARYAEELNRAIDSFEQNLLKAVTKAELIEEIKTNTVRTQHHERKNNRLERVRTIGRAQSTPRFQLALSVAQTRATRRIVEVIEHAKQLGLVRSEVNGRVFATFIQAYTLGKVIDDISIDPLDIEDWNDFINETLINYLIGFEN